MDTAQPPFPPRFRLTPDDGRTTHVPPGALSAQVFAHGSMELRWFSPGEHDGQTPHDRDEVYFIVAGTAVFLRAEEGTPFADEHMLSIAGDERVAVVPGDVLFVPAGTAHGFEAPSADFGCWSLFYGPEGGEPA